jgi:hypothetical protein
LARYLLFPPYQPDSPTGEPDVSAASGGKTMQLKEAYLERAVAEVEDLSGRVTTLKDRFARQRVNVKLEHYWELEYVRRRFSEFKHRIQELEDADEIDIGRTQEAVEIAWKDLIHAVDTLLAALP